MLSKKQKELFLKKANEILSQFKLLNRFEKRKINHILHKFIYVKSVTIKLLFDKRKDLIDTYIENELKKLNNYLEREESEDALDKYFKRFDYEVEFNRLEGMASSLKLGQEKKAIKIDNELSKFANMLKEKDEKFFRMQSERINEISGDMLYIISNGQIGSSRKFAKLKKTGK